MLNDQLELLHPNSMAVTIRGTEFVIDHSQLTGTTAIAMYEGAVDLEFPNGNSETIVEGEVVLQEEPGTFLLDEAESEEWLEFYNDEIPNLQWYAEGRNAPGCLIATASYGSALANEVQMLREIRDGQLLQTESGSAFMEQFNTYYYTFAPTISSWENENPIFKEVVRTTITPLIASLSLLQYVSMDTEGKVLFYGISMIMLNIGMYFALTICYNDRD